MAAVATFSEDNILNTKSNVSGTVFIYNFLSFTANVAKIDQKKYHAIV